MTMMTIEMALSQCVIRIHNGWIAWFDDSVILHEYAHVIAEFAYEGYADAIKKLRDVREIQSLLGGCS